jgi:type II secretory ATPase GspE/PulE/Tfp pilus assembly ATPase PilB-like protein
MSDPDAVFGLSDTSPDANPSPGCGSDLEAGLSNGPDAVMDRFNLEQMVSLVESVLPFEACLYYQVIPLSIEAAHLHVGMVNPDDTAAADYVRRQVAYINYSPVSWPITADGHRQILSQYLSHKAKATPRPTPPTVAAPRPSSPSLTSPVHPADQATFIVDSPLTLPQEAPPTSSVAPTARVSTPAAADIQADQDSTSQDLSQASFCSPATPQPKPPLSLDLPSCHRSMSLASMGQLPPKELTQALLSRVLQDGIGRLYFERRKTTGRILWSKDGIVQAALDPLSLPLFQSVISEFKRLTHLPLLPTTKTKQVELERTYRQERVVLRFRLMASTHGEEATLQVLRGAALKFYQQQQIDNLGRSALTFAHRLQDQIGQIRARSDQTFTLEGMPTHTLTTISLLLKAIDSEISQLILPTQKD